MVDIASSFRTIWARGAAQAGRLRSFARATPIGFSSPLPRERSDADLARVIEAEIIPRLMLAHSLPLSAISTNEVSVGPRTLAAFARMTLSREAHALTAYVETLIEGGLTLDQVFVDLLVPTARRLGDDWNEDIISFTDVTIGLSRLQQVVRDLGQQVPTRDYGLNAPSACFVSAPGEQHVFGLFILDDYFRRDGWRTWLDVGADADDAAEAVASEWFDVFGLSATSDTSPELIAATIAKVRAASLNPDIFVMVGGRLFVEQPGLESIVKADATAETASDALIAARRSVIPRVCV